MKTIITNKTVEEAFPKVHVFLVPRLPSAKAK